MNPPELQEIIAQGESEYIEFKRCGNQPEADTFESICAFANSFGGTLFLGIEDDGELSGVEPSQVLPIMRNLINVTNNLNAFDAPIPLEFDQIEVGDRRVIRVTVPNSPQMHSYKGKVYERQGDADIIVRGSARLAEICIRKEGIYTERRIYEHVTIDDLRSDLIDEARAMALRKRKDHPWKDMSDIQLVESAGFFGKDYTSGKTGFNLAGIITLGKDDVIRSLCPTYKTDAVVRIHDKSRYDDRLTSTTNLIEAYRELSDFCRKQLPDRFLLEGDHAVSARDTIVRELLVNCLIHRELTSPFPAKVIIDDEGIRTENASRASFEGLLEPNTFNPLPKNPLIASFFVHIGLAEELGSGTRALFSNSQLYTGREPVLEEGIVFRAFVPTAPIGSVTQKAADVEPTSNAEADVSLATDPQAHILQLAARREGVKTSDLVAAGIPRRTAQRHISELVASGQLVSHGNGRSRVYRAE